MNAERPITACFSGHRAYAWDALAADESRLQAAVEAAVADGFRIFVTGMATGFDLAAAEAVLRLREKLRAGQPAEAALHEKMRAEWLVDSDSREKMHAGLPDGSPAGLPEIRNTQRPDIQLIAAIPFAGQAAGYSLEERERYDAILAAADRIHTLAEGYSHGCYYRRDEWMVDRSSRLICWYNARYRASGTRHTVRAAKAAGLEIVNIFRLQDTLF